MTTQTITATSAGTAPAGQRTPSSSLDKDAFLQLLTVSLRQQDPLAPSDGKEFFAQMAQMTMLEQITELAHNSAGSAKDARMTNAVGLMGRTVTYTGADGARTSGVVEQVTIADGKPTLTVGGIAGIDPETLLEVR